MSEDTIPVNPAIPQPQKPEPPVINSEPPTSVLPPVQLPEPNLTAQSDPVTLSSLPPQTTETVTPPLPEPPQPPLESVLPISPSSLPSDASVNVAANVITPQPITTTNQQYAVSAYQYASFGRRLLAVILDMMILGAINFMVGIMIGMAIVATGGGVNDPSWAVINILSGLLAVGYYIYFIGSRGQTLGKMALGIKVIRLDGQPIGYLKAFVRESIGKFVSFFPFFIPLGFLWMLGDPAKQTWHDKIAGTIVVRAN